MVIFTSAEIAKHASDFMQAVMLLSHLTALDYAFNSYEIFLFN